MEGNILLRQMIELFLIIACGYVLYKRNILSRDVDQHLSKMILNLTMPSLILYSVLIQSSSRDLVRVGQIFLISVLMYLLLPAISFLLVKILKVPDAQQGIYLCMNTYSNVGFMGFPVISALYGDEAILYAAIQNIVFNLSAYTCGILMVCRKTGNASQEQFSLKELFLSPGMLGTALAMLFYFFPVSLPSPVLGAMGSIGNLTSPVAMLLIGANLAEVPPKELLSDTRLYLFALLKQLALPLLAWPLLNILVSDTYIKGILMILLLMPTGNTVVLFANRYHLDDRLAVKGVFITTVLSIITIPLLFNLVGLG